MRNQNVVVLLHFGELLQGDDAALVELHIAVQGQEDGQHIGDHMLPPTVAMFRN